MTATNVLQKQLDGLLRQTWTAQDIRDRYHVTAMTVHLWRGRGLPAVVIPGTARPTVRFVKSDVIAWADQRGIKPRAAAAA